MQVDQYNPRASPTLTGVTAAHADEWKKMWAIHEVPSTAAVSALEDFQNVSNEGSRSDRL